MDQRLTRSMIDERRTSTRSRNPIGSVSPLHSQPKTSRRSVSPLTDHEKARKGSVSPFRGFVSPYNNQPKTPPSSVSPLKTPRGHVSSLHSQEKTPKSSVSPYNSKQKTPRGSVSPFRGPASPYNSQEKTPRGSVSPFRGYVSPNRTQEKTPRGPASPLRNQAKISIRSVSPLQNQPRTPSRSVSPLQNQPKTRSSSVSPLRNQVKTPSSSVSPLRNQSKAPRASVFPIRDEENTLVGPISPLHNNEKDPISYVSPSQIQENPNKGSVSPLRNPQNPNKGSVSPLQNQENPNTDSVSPIQNQEKNLPNYLKASCSTCHDICKYGSRNNSEDEKRKSVIPKRKKKIIKLRSLSSGKIVFSEQIELISVESSNSNEGGSEPVEWRDIVSYDALVPLKESKMEEVEFENSNLDVAKNPKLVDKKKKKTIIRIKDLFSKTEEIESKDTNLDDVKNSNLVEVRNKKLSLKETNERDNIDKERNATSARTNMDSNKKSYNRKEDKAAANSKSKSDEKYTKITDKSKPIGKPTTQKRSTTDVHKLSKEKKDKSSKSREVESENSKSMEKNKKDTILKDDKETCNIEKEKHDASSKSKMDSNKKSHNVNDDKEATTSKSKAINEESGKKFTTILDKFKSKEKNSKTDMYKLSKEKYSPRKKSIFSITRSSSGRRSHEGKIEKIVNRSKKGLNAPSTSSSNEPKEKTLHMVEPKSRKVSPKSSNSKPKEEQQIPLKPEKSKFGRGKVVELPADPNSPRKLRFRNRRGSNENLTGFQIGRRSFRRKGSIGSGSSNSNGQIVMLKHRDTRENKGLQGLFNSIIEETVNKLVKTRKSKVKALVGAFETVISLQGKKSVHVD